MKKKVFSIGMVLILVVFMLVGCSRSTGSTPSASTATSTAPSHWPKAITMVSGPMGGPWYPYVVELTELFTREIPEISWTGIEGSSFANLRLIEEGVDAQIGMSQSHVIMKAKEGTYNLLRPGETFDNVLVGNVLNHSFFTIIARADSGIKSFGDIATFNRFSPGTLNVGQYVVFEDMLPLYGLSYDIIKARGGRIDLVNYAEMTQALQDRQLHMGVYAGTIPNAAVMELDATTPAMIVPIEDNIMKQILELYPSLSTDIAPAYTYKGQPEPVECLTTMCTMIYSSKLPDDLIYRITRVLLENSEEMVALDPSLFYLNWDQALTGIPQDLCYPVVWNAIKEGPKK